MGEKRKLLTIVFCHTFHVGNPAQSEEVKSLKYPKIMENVNKVGAILCGVIVFVFAALAVMESILRKFGHPTVWTLNLTQSIFIWAAFLGSSWAFQEHGHVSVDLVRDLVDRHSKRADRLPRRVMSVIGYICAFAVVLAILYGAWLQTTQAIAHNQLEPYVFKLPHVVSTLPVVIGSVQMLLTLVFIILDLFAGGEKYM
jgi:TRAP-type C4-dicarboxylate transport system permease small subunit